MTAPARYRAVWGEDETLSYPKEFWIEKGLPAGALPEGDEIPSAVGPVYTARVEGDVELYETIRLAAEDADLDISFMVVGALEDDMNLLYVMEPETGGILQLDLERHDVRGVNSTFGLFVESLYHFARFIDADEGAGGRIERAVELRRTLKRLDPNAFQEDAWWPLVFAQLTV
ncbi:SUKH-4 family immunity protein [Glycomyces arizonensis]|uniref:SUKH-4 family immunity protein n=1 Tax=Glycomyces arizonensis TaxID=256035 RepID=UPI000417FF82|nr:SUKH-4 family immunity protein [Glycomyces arizonensis]